MPVPPPDASASGRSAESPPAEGGAAAPGWPAFSCGLESAVPSSGIAPRVTQLGTAQGGPARRHLPLEARRHKLPGGDTPAGARLPSSPAPAAPALLKGGVQAPTYTGDLLHPEVVQQGFHRGAVSGVQLIAVDADVELEPVGVGVRRRLPGG